MMPRMATTVFTAPHTKALTEASSNEMTPIRPRYLDFSSSFPIPASVMSLL